LLRNRKLILFASIFCLAAPGWAGAVAQIGGHTSFLTPDSFFLLGLTLLCGLAGAVWLPDSLPRRGEVLIRRISPAMMLAALPLLLAVIFWVNQKVFYAFLNSADEHSCYFLAECLRKGRLFAEPHPLSEFFNVVHVGNKGGKWFSVYPPGWPLLWSFGLRWGISDWLNPVMAVGAMFFFYKTARRLFGEIASGFGLFLAALTPFFIFTSASYFSHATCLFSIAVFLYAFLEWQYSEPESKRMIWAGIAAFAAGYGLMSRYLTMLAVAGPFLMYHFLPVIFRKRKWRASDTVAVAILAVFSGLILYQNYAVTGKLFRAPNRHDKSWERLGFRKNYTPLDGLIFVLTRLFYLMDWMAPVLPVFFVASLFLKRRFDPLRQLFRFGAVFIAAAYFFYFSWGGNQFGPRYYFEGVLFLGIVVAEYVIFEWKRSGPSGKKFLMTILIMAILSDGYLFHKQTVFYERATRERKDLYRLAASTLTDPSIVFIKGFLGDSLVLSEDDAVRNSPFLDGRILYAHDLGEKNKTLIAAYPGRRYYRGTYDRKSKRAVLEIIHT
jgi:hypothetical protein